MGNNATEDTGFANCSLYLNEQFNQTNSSAILNGEVNNFTLDLVEGEYNWSVECYDTAGLYNWSENRTFYVDFGFPSINLSYPEIDDVVYSSTVEFNFTVTDNMDGLLTCNLTVDGDVVDSDFNASNGTVTNRTVPGLGIGDHLWNVTCWDGAWNLNFSETRNFTIADFPPNATLTSPYDGYWNNDSSIILYYNASDNNDLANCSLYLNGQFNQSNSSALLNGEINNFTVGLIADGEYDWSINCTDNEGLNGSSEIWTFYIDTRFPQITLNAPWNNNFSLSSNLSFNFTVTDNMDDNLTCNLTVDGLVDSGFNASNDSLTNRQIAGLVDGENYWNVTCMDNAGNTNTSETWMINVTEYPSVILNTDDNEYFNYTDILFLVSSPELLLS